MKLQVNLRKRYFVVFLAVALVLGGSLLAYAYGTSSPSTFGHSAGEVDVTIGDTKYTLQKAIDDNLIGGGSGSSGSGGFTNFKVYNQAGDDRWTAPSGVTKALVEVWGSGASAYCYGGIPNKYGSMMYSFGGGGGGYGREIVTVVPDQPYDLTIALGGQYPSSMDGRSSSFVTSTKTVSASGGSSNYMDNFNDKSPVGGTSNALFKINGEKGNYVPFSDSSMSVSIGGSGANGGSGGRSSIGGTDQGSVPESPGGGSACGKNGADGRVVIWW